MAYHRLDCQESNFLPMSRAELYDIACLFHVETEAKVGRLEQSLNPNINSGWQSRASLRTFINNGWSTDSDSISVDKGGRDSTPPVDLQWFIILVTRLTQLSSPHWLSGLFICRILGYRPHPWVADHSYEVFPVCIYICVPDHRNHSKGQWNSLLFK